MRIAEVIGSVTLSRVHPTLVGARMVIAVPLSLKALREGAPDGEDLVIYDYVGAGIGDRIGFCEGAEGAAPFHRKKKPVDAYCACILDQIMING